MFIIIIKKMTLGWVLDGEKTPRWVQEGLLE
jgi:hypothetical protein